MKNLDIQNLNLKEISKSEMEEVNGGFLAALLVGFAVGLAIAAWIKE